MKLTKKQKEWIEMCQKHIGDPIGLDLYLSDGGDFRRDVVERTCRWWEGHSIDVLHKLQSGLDA